MTLFEHHNVTLCDIKVARHHDEIRGINTNPLSRVLEIPYLLEPGQEIEVYLNDDKGYHVCKMIVNSEEKKPEKVNFTYP